MMMQITIDKLIAMKLSGMVEGLEEQINSPVYNDLSFDERFSMLVDKEMTSRENRRLSMLMRRARFRHPNACVEEIDFRAKRGIRKETVLKLAQNEWIKKHRNLIITGPTGVGKTYLACAFGISACRKGISTCYVRLPRFLQEVKVARADGSYIKLLGKISRIQVLIVDDWGLSPLNDTERRDFLEIVEDRHNVRSTIVSTQYPVSKWHKIIDDPTIADAICDRLVHNAYTLNLKGESMRKLQSDLT
ncbi:MAG: IS21-like element helper ATPase IstB [Deltaproteobacteria bacterium]|nr:IS21-like element helper ATPase IstB [Deltaproteobacteria bacterium]